MRRVVKYTAIGLVVVLALFSAPWVVDRVSDLIEAMNPLRALVDQLQSDLQKSKAKNADLVVVRDSINTELQRAYTLNTTKESEIQRLLAEINEETGENANLLGVVDSLQGEIEGLRRGGGDVSIGDTGVLKDSTYEDDWIRIRLLGNDSLTYKFEFRISDIAVDLVDDAGNQQTIYSVWISSLRNPAHRKVLDTYAVEETRLKPGSGPRLNWWDPRVLAGVQVIGGAQAHVMFASSNWAPAGYARDNSVLLVFPVVGVASDFDKYHSLTAGVSVNLGYFTPVIRDLYLSTGVGLSFLSPGGSRVYLSLSTSI